MTLMIRRTGASDYGRYLKALIAGPSGSGKTTLSATAPNPLIADCEGGLMSVADRKIPYANIETSLDVQQLRTALDQAPEARKELIGISPETVVIDTVDEVQRLFVRERLRETGKETMTMQDFGWLKDRMLDMIRSYRNLPLHVIFLCLGGGTPVVTQSGIVPIRDLDGPVEILAGDGKWRVAEFSYMGDQELYRVVFTNGDEVLATAGHRWLHRGGHGDLWCDTTQLAGKRIPITVAEKPERDEDFRRGVVHGIVFGDGCAPENHWHTHVTLYDGKRELLPWLEPYASKTRELKNYAGRKDPGLLVTGLPADLKDLPATDASLSYWYGFTLGLIATDGSVGNGTVTLHQVDPTVLNEIQARSVQMGFYIRSEPVWYETTGYAGTTGMHRLVISKWSVDESDLLRSFHRERHSETTWGSTLKVKSVEPTGRVEPVYCCEEPVTHLFTIGRGVTTGNCHTKEVTDEETGVIYTKPGLQGAVADEIAAYMDVVGLLAVEEYMDVEDDESVRKVRHVLQLQPTSHVGWLKDRSGKLPAKIPLNGQTDFKRIVATVFAEVPEEAPAPKQVTVADPVEEIEVIERKPEQPADPTKSEPENSKSENNEKESTPS